MQPSRSLIRLSVWLGLLVCGLGADPLGPGSGRWVEEDPAAHGLDPALLEAARRSVFGIRGRRCLVVAKDGALVYEAYSELSNQNSSHLAYSMTKTLGALIVGASKLDIDRPVEGYGLPSPRPYPVTARQIMSQALAGEAGPGQAWEYDAVGVRWVNLLARLVAAAGDKPSVIWQRQFQQPLGLADSFRRAGCRAAF